MNQPTLSCLDEPRKNSMQFNQLLMSWFRVKSMKMSMWFLSYHHASCIAHSPGEWAHMHFKNMVFSFNPWTRQRGTMVFSSWTSIVTYTFYCIILVYHLSPLNWGFSKKNSTEGKKDKVKSTHIGLYLRGCKLWSQKEQLKEHFEFMLFKFAWFSHQLYIKLFHMHQTFYLLYQVFFKGTSV